jgi:hypothetical protein
MASFLSRLLHPLIFLNLWAGEDEDSGVDLLFMLTVFIAAGIWLVVRRYQQHINGAVDFFCEAPEVPCIHMSPRTYVHRQ